MYAIGDDANPIAAFSDSNKYLADSLVDTPKKAGRLFNTLR